MGCCYFRILSRGVLGWDSRFKRLTLAHLWTVNTKGTNIMRDLSRDSRNSLQGMENGQILITCLISITKLSWKIRCGVWKNKCSQRWLSSCHKQLASRIRTEISEAGLWMMRKIKHCLLHMLSLRGIGCPSESITGFANVKSRRQVILEVWILE